MKKELLNVLTNSRAEIFFNDVLIMHEGEKREYYIDPRTKRDDETGLNEVKPIAFISPFYFYICPDCGQVHMTINFGKIQTGCCLDIDCERHQKVNSNSYFIKREPIYLLDEE